MYFVLYFFLLLEFLSSSEQGLCFPLLLFLLFEPFYFSVLDLLNDNLVSSNDFLLLALLFLLVVLDLLQPLHFHHQVFLLFMNLVVLPDFLLFVELSVSDGHRFSVCNHFVHFLYVFQLLLREL